MKCLDCSKEMSHVTAGTVTVDVCREGCGGMWFDKAELQRLDDASEHAGETLLAVKAPVSKSQGSQKKCPKCPDMVMARHHYNVKHRVEIDECYKCHGVWLNPGELGAIRSEYKTDAERLKAFDAYFNSIFADKIAAEKSEAALKDEKIRQMFKYVCPSYYIPGKQEGGAF